MVYDLSHIAASLWAASGRPFEMIAAELSHGDASGKCNSYLHFFAKQWHVTSRA
ncbi:MAG: hypothetical protein WBF71_11750 [Microthrixaceae bacterium]